MRSKPGMYEQYNGFVPVYADNEDEAIQVGAMAVRFIELISEYKERPSRQVQ
jgi:hypothetical protein